MCVRQDMADLHVGEIDMKHVREVHLKCFPLKIHLRIKYKRTFLEQYSDYIFCCNPFSYLPTSFRRDFWSLFLELQEFFIIFASCRRKWAEQPIYLITLSKLSLLEFGKAEGVESAGRKVLLTIIFLTNKKQLDLYNVR